jgi:acetyl esterase/lipase
VHGGAWTYFDRRADAYFDRALAASGMVVVALDFRQGAAHPWPTAVADVVAGIRWTKANAGRSARGATMWD